MSGLLRRRLLLSGTVLSGFAGLYAGSESVRDLTTAAQRTTRVGVAVTHCIIDYKLLFRKTWDESTPEGKLERHLDYEDTHTRCARRIRNVLIQNGGVYIKIGQHLSANQLIPVPWSREMLPLQDQCTESDVADLARLYVEETGETFEQSFSSFDPVPIGVASLAQVHRAVDHAGAPVAVKIMHPGLQRFCEIDIRTTDVMLAWVRAVFPDFEFTWLARELRENLPKELDFRNEIKNAARLEREFAETPSALYLPRFRLGTPRVLVMEYIDGARIDDHAYFERHGISRNEVAREISAIFAQMVYVNGFFHADPHGGNILVRAKPSVSTAKANAPLSAASVGSGTISARPTSAGSALSAEAAQETKVHRPPNRHNFEIVLLDHGLYVEIPRKLRLDYANFWLALMDKHAIKERKYYAIQATGIEESLYPVLEAALTGRRSMANESIMDLGAQTADEQREIRRQVVDDGIFMSVLNILKTVPSPVLMVLKVNDLTRALDKALATTHDAKTVFLVMGERCNQAVHNDAAFSFYEVWRFLRWATFFRLAELSLSIKSFFKCLVFPITEASA